MQSMLYHALSVDVCDRLDPPASYTRFADAQLVRVDGVAAWRVRYERNDGMNAGLGGEHYSVVVTEQGRLLGTTWFNQALVAGELPDEDEAYRIALEYLECHASDLLPGLSLQWIQPHDELFVVGNASGGKRVCTLTGMKVKCRNRTDGRYFWVIVGVNGQVVTFERDVVWDTPRARRQTEKWLHDEWLATRRAA